MTLFRYEAFTNLSYLGVGILWLLTLVLWLYTPGLLAVAVHSLRSRGRDAGMGYIARFAPINLFRFLVYLVNSLGIGFLSLRLMGLMGALPAGKQDYQGMLLFVGGVSLGCYAFLYLRSRLFWLWRYLFFGGLVGETLRQDYFFLDWLRALCLAPLGLLCLSPLPAPLLLQLTLGLLLVIQGLGILQLIRRLAASSAGYVLLFLYLCAHELAPFLYLLGLGRYLGMYS